MTSLLLRLEKRLAFRKNSLSSTMDMLSLLITRGARGTYREPLSSHLGAVGLHLEAEASDTGHHTMVHRHTSAVFGVVLAALVTMLATMPMLLEACGSSK